MMMRTDKTVLEMTPEDVVSALRSSDDPGVVQAGDDLAALYGLGGRKPEPPASDLVAVLPHLSKIVDEDGKFIYGANAEIAEHLFGDRTLTGGSYNRIIQAVKRDLRGFLRESTTTTAKIA